jgi:hypothetical protein
MMMVASSFLAMPAAARFFPAVSMCAEVMAVGQQECSDSATPGSVPGYDDGEGLKLELPLAQSAFSPLRSAAWLKSPDESLD